MGVAAAHLHRVVRELRRRDDVVLVHDHQEAFGPTVLAALGRRRPPVLHTLHWDLRKHPELYGDIDGGGSLWVNGVSFAQLTTAPPALRALSVGHVHLATPLAVDADRRPAVRKGDHLVVMGRITRYKGQAVAARLAHRTGSGWSSPARSGRTTAPRPRRRGRRRGQPGRPVLAGGGRAAGRRASGCAGSARSRAWSATTWSPPRGPRSSRSTGRSPAAPRSSSRSRWARRWSASAAGACRSWSRTAAPGCWSTPATRTRWPPRSPEAARLDPRTAAGRPRAGSPRRDGRALPAALRQGARPQRAARGGAGAARHL